MFIPHERDHQSRSLRVGERALLQSLAGGSALWGFVNVLAVRWRKSNKNLLRIGFFSVHRNFQRTSVISVSTIPVNVVRHCPPFYFLFFRHSD